MRHPFQPKGTDIFLISPQKRGGQSLEALPQGASDEYPQHTFSWRNK